MTGFLPSGLPDRVGDDEDLARILRSSSHFTSSTVKAAAFMPARDSTTSVIRHGADPRESLWQHARKVLGAEVRHGAAICRALVAREERLDVLADEPPPRHANVIGWPANPDPELEKAQRKEIALQIASKSKLIRI